MGGSETARVLLLTESSDGIILHQDGNGRLASWQRVMKAAYSSALIDADTETMRVFISNPASLNESFERKGKVGRCRAVHAKNLTHVRVRSRLEANAFYGN